MQARVAKQADSWDGFFQLDMAPVAGRGVPPATETAPAEFPSSRAQEVIASAVLMTTCIGCTFALVEENALRYALLGPVAAFFLFTLRKAVGERAKGSVWSRAG